MVNGFWTNIITGLSPLINIPGESIHFIRATRYAPLHIMMINLFGKTMAKLWRGNTKFDGPVTRSQRRTHERSRSQFNREIEVARNTVPAVIVRMLKDITMHGYTYFAAACTTFILLYPLPSFPGRLAKANYNNLRLYVDALKLLLRKDHTAGTSAKLRRLWRAFVDEFTFLYVDYRHTVYENGVTHMVD